VELKLKDSSIVCIIVLKYPHALCITCGVYIIICFSSEPDCRYKFTEQRPVSVDSPLMQRHDVCMPWLCSALRLQWKVSCLSIIIDMCNPCIRSQCETV